MKKYIIDYTKTSDCSIEVEANSESEAVRNFLDTRHTLSRGDVIFKGIMEA